MHLLHPISVTLCLAAQASAQYLFGQPFVQFPTDIIPTHLPQTANESALGSAVGRAPGPLEFLQPSLDINLAPYVKVAANLKGNYTLAASDVLAVLSKTWAAAFMQMYPNVTLNIPPPYAGSLGAVELIAGNLDGVFVSRELKPDDITGFTAAFGYPPRSIPISGGSYRQFGFLDAMAFVVNKENPIESLSFDQLDAILSTTHARGGKPITKWGQLGVVGPLATQNIKIYGIQPWNGFEEFIRQRVLSYNGTRGQWRSGNLTDNKDPDVTWASTVFNMSSFVANNSAGLAYTGLAYIDSRVKVLGTMNHTGDVPIPPTYENIASAKWPLARVTYFNTNKNPNKTADPVLTELTKFVLSRQGQQLLLNQGIYLPFRASQQAASLAMLQ